MAYAFFCIHFCILRVPVQILLMRDTHARFGSWKVIQSNYSPVETVNRPTDTVSSQLSALSKCPFHPQQKHSFQWVEQLKSSGTACLHLLYISTFSESPGHLLLQVLQWLYKPQSPAFSPLISGINGLVCAFLTKSDQYRR